MEEYDEVQVLTMLEVVGCTIRRLKAEFIQLCSGNEFVQGSTILEFYDKIETKQREFARLDDLLTELENAF